MFAATNFIFAGGLDPLVAAHQAKTGATDLNGLNELIRYVRGQSLLPNFVIYPMKSAQNYGSGSTVEPLGELTSNAMTLVNSPTWGASGVAFNGINQHATVLSHGITQDPIDGIASFTRFAFATASTSDEFNTTNPRNLFNWANGTDINSASVLARVLGGKPNQAYRNAINTAFLRALGDTHIIGTGDQTCVFITGASALRNFVNKNEVSYSAQDTPASGQSSGDDWYFMSQQGLTRFADCTATASAVITGPLTTTQRETITDLINAL